ncbi:hypothetical protein FB645_001431 [Coemansia sp. IMI 203386]|nr:hypothetical protein FB645_001431 [Coemansia sp. IMI 203386]
MDFSLHWSIENISVLLKHIADQSYFRDGKLLFHCHYFTNREMQIIEFGQDYYRRTQFVDNQDPQMTQFIVQRLDYDSGFSESKDYNVMYKMISSVQHETSNFYSMRQINEKLQQIMNNWVEPLRNIKNSGYFRGQHKIQPHKTNICKLFEIDAAMPAMTNRDIINKFCIRALREYLGMRELLWDSENKCRTETPFAVAPGTKLDNFIEFSMWLNEMIGRHGQETVDFMDACVVNVLNSYIVELISTDTNISDYTFVTNSESRLRLELLLGEILTSMTDL